MARKVVWSFEATADLEAIADYIARDSSFYAASFVIEVREASRSLNEFSERGRIVPELSNPSIRELFIKDYRLIYQIEESCVDILGLIHGRRDLKTLWKKEQRENVGITTKMVALRKQIMAGMKAGGSVKLIETDPNEAILELINILDRNISVGIGQAISINYIKDEMDAIKRTVPNNKPKD